MGIFYWKMPFIRPNCLGNCNFCEIETKHVARGNVQEEHNALRTLELLAQLSDIRDYLHKLFPQVYGGLKVSGGFLRKISGGSISEVAEYWLSTRVF